MSNAGLIVATLKQHNGSKTKAAEALGISLKTLYNRLAEYQEADAQVGVERRNPDRVLRRSPAVSGPSALRSRE